MTESVRQAQALLHSTIGVASTALLVLVFWMGSLSVFSKEIDRWMIPETRPPLPAVVASVDLALKRNLPGPYLDGAVVIILPDERTPVFRFELPTTNGESEIRVADASNGAPIALSNSLGATGFLVPFHYSLHLGWERIGYWIVALLSVGMLSMLVSGVVIHRKLFAEFFVFRPEKQRRRSLLDLHGLMGIAILPFAILMPLSGVLTAVTIYLGWSILQPFGGDAARMESELFGSAPVHITGAPTPVVSLDAMIREAERRWQMRDGRVARVDRIDLTDFGREGGTAVLTDIAPQASIATGRHVMTFDLSTGAVIKDWTAPPVRHAHAWLMGAHFTRSGPWFTRVLMFVCGLVAAAMMAVGLLFWLESRRRGDKARESAGFRTVECMAIGATTGLVLATLAYFAANRALALVIEPGHASRPTLEVFAFAAVWVLAAAHGWRHGLDAWRRQVGTAAALAGLAVALDILTTGSPFPAISASGPSLAAGVDFLLVIVSCIGAVLVRRSAPRTSSRRNDTTGTLSA